MRIVFLAVDDEFAGEMQRFVYESHPEWVVGSIISTCAIYKKNKLQAGLFVLRKSGPIYLMEMVKMKILRRLMKRKEDTVTPMRLAKEHAVKVFFSHNINSDESLTTLRRLQPDVVISTNFSHYVGKKARSIAKYGSWNLHKSYLPHYRGMAPNFFALLEGASFAGATLHVLAKGFDTGPILKQVRVPIDNNDNVYSLNKKSSISGGRMLAEYLETMDLNNIRAIAQPQGDWPNHTYPSPAEIRRFRRMGLKFDRF